MEKLIRLRRLEPLHLIELATLQRKETEPGIEIVSTTIATWSTNAGTILNTVSLAIVTEYFTNTVLEVIPEQRRLFTGAPQFLGLLNI